MTDVPFTVAVIASVAPIIASAVPIIVNAIRDDRRDRRDRQDRLAQERRGLELEQREFAREQQQMVVRLLGAARDLRVLVENYYDYYGVEKAVRAWEIRQQAARVTGQAEEIGLQIPGIGEAADTLAEAAGRIASSAASATSIKLGASPQKPDFTEIDRCIKDFKAAARVVLHDRPGVEGGPPNGGGQDRRTVTSGEESER